MSENQVLQSLYTAELCNRNTFYEFLRWGQNEILPWETSPHHHPAISCLYFPIQEKEERHHNTISEALTPGSIKLCMKGVRFEIIVCDHPQLLPPPFAKFKQHLQAKLSVVDKIQNPAGRLKLYCQSRSRFEPLEIPMYSFIHCYFEYEYLDLH